MTVHTESKSAIKDKEKHRYDREMYYVIEMLSSVLYKFASFVGNRHHKNKCIKGSTGLSILPLGCQMTEFEDVSA